MVVLLTLCVVPLAARQVQPPSPAAPGPTPQVTPQPSPAKTPTPTPPAPTFPSAVKWSATVDAAPVAPPLVGHGLVVLALRSGAVTAYQASDGTVAWTVTLLIDQPMAADDDRLFVVTGETLHALRAATGETLWSVPVGPPSAPVVARGGWVIAASAGTVTALRGTDGVRIWTKATGAVSERVAIDGDALFVPLIEGRLLALDLKTGSVTWDRPVGIAPTEPLAFDNRVYIGSDTKRFACLHAKTGKEEWGWEIGTRLIGPAAADASRVYFTGMDNRLRALSRSNGGQRWTYPLAYRPSRGPVVMGGQVAVPGITKELLGFEVASGKSTGKLTFPVQLAMVPSFIAPEADGGEPAVVSITGGLTSQWTLALSLPAPPPPPPKPAAEPPK